MSVHMIFVGASVFAADDFARRHGERDLDPVKPGRGRGGEVADHQRAQQPQPLWWATTAGAAAERSCWQFRDARHSGSVNWTGSASFAGIDCSGETQSPLTHFLGKERLARHYGFFVSHLTFAGAIFVGIYCAGIFVLTGEVV